MIQFVPLGESHETHFAKELFESSFPEDERPPFGEVEERTQENFHFDVIMLDDDEPIGIMTYWTFDEYTYVEHFAIHEDYRGRGIGRAAFLEFLTQYSDQVVLEIELPGNDTSDRRMEFYTDMGFYPNPQEYWQPSYHKAGTLALPMLLMSKYELDDDDFAEVRDTLYKTVYNYKA
ncbi:MAG: GNAT family N-acetyltransferase [Bacteroidales bacterium]|nr:GNAT family N-acetyltransferase [Bacteroidales bacterium]